ncbi:PAS domain S-box protein [Paenibacillus aurantiacus]|uniref:histidine kinase n=1 Tax=Paenibacillus aurantiacus TaxID=1936118 RepID=A0ABV5KIR7_9BACL
MQKGQLCLAGADWMEETLHALGIALGSYDCRSGTLSVSRGVLALTGYEPSHFATAGCWVSMIETTDTHLYEAAVAMVKRGEPAVAEYRIRTREGRSKWVQMRIAPLMDGDGGIGHYNALAVDISARKEAESVAMMKERRYRSLFDHSLDTVIEFDLEGNVKDINRETQLLFGVPMEDVLGRPLYPYLSQEEGAKAERMLTQVVQGYSAVDEIVTQPPGMPPRQWAVSCTPITVDGEIQGIFAICRELTEERRLARQYAESDRLFHLVTSNMRDVITVTDRQGQTEYVSPTVRVVLGYGAEEFATAEPYAYVYSQDRDQLKETLGEIVRMRKPRQMQARYRHAEGYLVDVDLHGTPILNERGEVENVVVIARDISDKVRAERALRESEERYRLLFELSPEPIFVQKARRLTMVNSAAVRLFGASKAEELIGIDPIELIDPAFMKLGNERRQELERGKRTDLLNLRMRKLSGEAVEVEATSTPIGYGEQQAILSVFRDITARMRSERDRACAVEMLRESEERYSRLQLRLDAFSQELMGIMSVRELEQRLLREIREVLGVKRVEIIALTADPDGVAEDAVTAALRSHLIAENGARKLGELTDWGEGHYLSLGVFKGSEHILYIGESSANATFESKRIWLKTMIRYVKTIYDNFRIIEDLSNELKTRKDASESPPWFSRFLFTLSENERRRLAQDLHDSALQEQIIWYRKLDSLLEEPLSEESRDELLLIKEGLLDVVYQIRLTCNELRPPLLREIGLVASLEQLFHITQLRSDYSVDFKAIHVRDDLPGDLALALYRIVQELLANATKHSNASIVRIRLVDNFTTLQLLYDDNGIGLPQTSPARTSMGLSGIQERARSLNGAVVFDTSPDQGLSVTLSFPLNGDIREEGLQ